MQLAAISNMFHVRFLICNRVNDMFPGDVWAFHVKREGKEVIHATWTLKEEFKRDYSHEMEELVSKHKMCTNIDKLCVDVGDTLYLLVDNQCVYFEIGCWMNEDQEKHWDLYFWYN